MTDPNLTTFIISTIRRPTLERALKSVKDLPHLIGYDDHHEGPGAVRNRLIAQAATLWVSFLDDDDSITEDYVERLQEEIEKTPYADVIHFRQYFLRGHILPSWPIVEWGNVGIAYSIQREVALQFPFRDVKYEDYDQVKRVSDAGKAVVFSPYITYRVRH